MALNGSNQTLSGSTTFDTLSKAVGAGDTLSFAATTTQHTLTALNLNGSSSTARLALRSTISGVKWNLFPEHTRSVSFLDVGDSKNTFTTIACSNGCNDSGNNTAWDFTSASSDTSTTTAGTGGGGGGGGGGGVRHAPSASTTSPAPKTGLPTTPPVTKKMEPPKNMLKELLKKRIEARKAAAAAAKAARAAKAAAKKKTQK